MKHVPAGLPQALPLSAPLEDGSPHFIPQTCLWTGSLFLKTLFPLCSWNIKNLKQSSLAFKWASFYALVVFFWSLSFLFILLPAINFGSSTWLRLAEG